MFDKALIGELSSLLSMYQEHQSSTLRIWIGNVMNYKFTYFKFNFLIHRRNGIENGVFT